LSSAKFTPVEQVHAADVKSDALEVTVNDGLDPAFISATLAPRWKLFRPSISSISKTQTDTLIGRKGSTPKEVVKPKRKLALLLLARKPRQFFLADASQPSTSGTMDSELAAAFASAKKKSVQKLQQYGTLDAVPSILEDDRNCQEAISESTMKNELSQINLH